MHSLFIIRTPLQLLSAYIVAEQMTGGTNNDLILINHRDVLTDLLYEAGMEIPQTHSELVTLLQGLR